MCFYCHLYMRRKSCVLHISFQKPITTAFLTTSLASLRPLFHFSYSNPLIINKTSNNSSKNIHELFFHFLKLDSSSLKLYFFFFFFEQSYPYHGFNIYWLMSNKFVSILGLFFFLLWLIIHKIKFTIRGAWVAQLV